MVLVRGFVFSGGTGSLKEDAETFLPLCGSSFESADEKYSTADWPSLIF